MQPIDDLLALAETEKLQVVEHPFQTRRLKGLYTDGVITINKSAKLTTRQKVCVLAEELGHHFTSCGNILNQKDVSNRKQERRALQWGFKRVIPLTRIIEAYHARITGRHELAAYLGVTESFLQSTINRYRDIYGIFVQVGERYLIYFEPLSVCEIFIES